MQIISNYFRQPAKIKLNRFYKLNFWPMVSWRPTVQGRYDTECLTELTKSYQAWITVKAKFRLSMFGTKVCESASSRINIFSYNFICYGWVISGCQMCAVPLQLGLWGYTVLQNFIIQFNSIQIHLQQVSSAMKLQI